MSGLNGQFNARLQRLEKMNGDALPTYTNSDTGKVLKIVAQLETITVLPIQTVTTNTEGNAEITGADFSRLTNGGTVVVDFDGGKPYNMTYNSTPNEGLYYGDDLIIDSTTIYTTPLGAPSNIEFTISAYAELPPSAEAEWEDVKDAFIIRLVNTRTDKTYSEIESALRSGRPCTLIRYVDSVITETGIVFNAIHDTSLEKPYTVSYLIGATVESMFCENANDTLVIE